LKAFQAQFGFALLFVNDPKSEIDFVCFFEMGIHADYATESFLGVFETSITIVKDANAIPQLGLGFGGGNVV